MHANATTCWSCRRSDYLYLIQSLTSEGWHIYLQSPSSREKVMVQVDTASGSNGRSASPRVDIPKPSVLWPEDTWAEQSYDRYIR